jgi:HEAT repeat protein
MSDDKYAQRQPFDALNPRGLSAKREYVQGLEQRRDPEALSLLIECLCDESWYLRDLATQSFLRLGDAHADLLVPLLDTGLWYTRTNAAFLLGRLAWRRAVPPLVQLADDANRTVADAARDALLAIARQGGSFRVAHVLYRDGAERRRRRLEELRERDRATHDRIERMLRNDELMSAADEGALADDSPVVRHSEDGVVWEVLTSPPSSQPSAVSPLAGGHAEPRDA